LGCTPTHDLRINSLKHDLVISLLDTRVMTSAVDGWPVFIPLIVGLAPGLIYWIAITAKRK